MENLLLQLYPTLDNSDGMSKTAAVLNGLPEDVLATLAFHGDKLAAMGKRPGDQPEKIHKKEYPGTGKITAYGREQLKTKQFAIPASAGKKKGVSVEPKGEAKGSYPVDTLRRGRNALARVSTFGTPAEKQMVRRKVYGKFPQLRHGFEERHGVSPTSKGMLSKQKTGGQTPITPSKNDWVPKWGGEVTKYLEEEKMRPLFGTLKNASAGSIFRTAMKVASCCPSEMADAIKKTAASMLKEAEDKKRKTSVVQRIADLIR